MYLTSQELINLEKQLRCPEGKEGIAVSKIMNETNLKMTKGSVKALKLKDKEFFLELGHGNCGHLEEVYNYSNEVSYFGLEISKTMKTEAEKLNSRRVLSKKASFYLYDGKTIPFSNDSFDKVMTVNTIYFWEDPKLFLLEIVRVLKQGGFLIVTFVKPESMSNLPFVNDRFKLYDKESIIELIADTGLELVEFIDQYEKVKSKAGDLVNREYTITKLIKK